MAQRLSSQHSISSKRRAPTDPDVSLPDPHAEWPQVQSLIQKLSEVAGTAQMPRFVAQLEPGLLSHHPSLLLALANAATNGAGENADLLEDIARKCLQATQLMAEPSGTDALAVWQSLIAQLRGLQDRLARTLLQALEAFPVPEAVQPDFEQARQAVSVSTPSEPQPLMPLPMALVPALAGNQTVQIGPTDFVWPMEIVAIMARPPAPAAALGTVTAFFREVNRCLAWLLVSTKLQAIQQPKLNALLHDWMRHWQIPTRTFTPPTPRALSMDMLHVYNFSCFASKAHGRDDPLLLMLNEATQAHAPRQMQALLPHLWTQACLKWTYTAKQSELLAMGQRLLAQLDRCSLAVQRRLLVGMAYGGNSWLQQEALKRLRSLERHPGGQQRLPAEGIQRCMNPAPLSNEDNDAVLLDLEQTPPDQVTEIPYLRQLAKLSHQTLSRDQRERALRCALAILHFEARCDELGAPQTAHKSLFYEISQWLRTDADRVYAELKRQQL